MRRAGLVFAVSTITVFTVYAFTSSPGLGLVDSGELTAVACKLGIAHPSGYPLYTLLGRVWQLLPLASSDRWMVLFSACCGAVAMGFAAVVCLRVLDSLLPQSRAANRSSSILLSLGLAFTTSTWSGVAFAEVYPLSWVIAAAILLASVTIFDNRQRITSLPFLVSYLWGLGLGNHLTILWFAPLVVFVVLGYVRRSEKPRTTLLQCTLALLLGASVNLYLPLRSSVEPSLDWGDPQNLDNLLRHLTGWQYRVWMFDGDVGSLLRKLAHYFTALPWTFGWALLLLAVVGVLRSIALRRGYVYAALITWLLGVLYNLNYDIPDIETYFAAFHFPLILLAAIGFASVVRLLQRGFKTARLSLVMTITLAAVPCATGFAFNYRACVERENRFAESVAREVLRTLPDSALALQGNWDIQSPVIYLQKIEGLRPDVVMLDVNLMQRSWYLKQERRAHPEIFAESEPEIAAFLRLVRPFEDGALFDAAFLEKAFVAVHNRIIQNQRERRPVYLRDAQESGHPGIGASFRWLPGAYFNRVAGSSTPETIIDARQIVVNPLKVTVRERFLLRQLALAAVRQGTHFMDVGDTMRVRRARASALQLGREMPVVQQFADEADKFLASSPRSP